MIEVIDRWLRRAWRDDRRARTRLPGTHPVTVVTGGSDGIGRALALTLADRSSHVLLVARDPAKLQTAADTIHERAPTTRVHLCGCDLTDIGAIEQIDSRLRDIDGYVDILVNNAGVGFAGDFIAQSDSDLTNLLQLNVLAAVRLMRHVLPAMTLRGRGGIINIASLGGLTPGPYQTAYYASKACLISVTRAVAWEVRGQGVRVCVVAPGPVETDFHARMGADHAFYRIALPPLTPDRVARSTVFWFDLGATFIVPGIVNKVMAIALHLLPPILIIPIIAVLLRPRAGPGDATSSNTE